MPKINFSATLTNLYGTVMQHVIPDPADPSKKLEVPLTLRHCAVEALLANEQGMDGKTKVSRYNLATRIHECKEVLELKVKESALIQKQLAKSYGPLIVGQAYPLLEGIKEEDLPDGLNKKTAEELIASKE